MSDYYAWHSLAKNLSITDRIEEGARAFESRFKRKPTSVLLSATDNSELVASGAVLAITAGPATFALQPRHLHYQ